MHDAGKIILGLILFLGIVTYPVWHNAMNGKAGYIPTPKAPLIRNNASSRNRLFGHS
jgi:hypothetical protein